nr:lysophospholipid acyltransferase family protein [Desulfobacterales bacterium]
AILYIALPYLRRITYRNLRLVYPRWPSEQVHGFARRVFRHFGMTLIEAAHMACLPPEKCLERIDIKGDHHITAATAKGQSLIIISAHLGSWETALQVYPLVFKHPLLCVAKVLGLGRVDRLVIRSRTRFGNLMIPKKRAFDKMLKCLRHGGSVGLMMDLNRQKQAVDVRFMGHRASASLGAAMLAMRSNSPVFLATCIRAPNGRLKMQITPAIEMRRTSDLRADLQENTQRITATIEEAVCRHPEQWFWMQKRWETYHDGLYARASAWNPGKLKKKLKKQQMPHAIRKLLE